MNSLQSRKKLLIAESEINRAHAVAELMVIKAEVGTLIDRAQSLVMGVSKAAVIVAGLSALLGRKTAGPPVKRSWWQTALKGAGFIFSVWPVFRAKPEDRKV